MMFGSAKTCELTEFTLFISPTIVTSCEQKEVTINLIPLLSLCLNLSERLLLEDCFQKNLEADLTGNIQIDEQTNITATIIYRDTNNRIVVIHIILHFSYI